MTVTKKDPASPGEPEVRSPKGHEAAANNAKAKHDQRSLLDMMEEMPRSDGIEFDPPRVVIELQEVNFDSDR